MQKVPPVTDSHHDKVQALLRLVGPLMAVLGVVLTAIGLISFFSAFGTFQPPRYFWAAIVGLPLIGVGLGLARLGYLGEIFRYGSEEVTPVASDTFNTMAEGTRRGVETMAQAVGRGMTSAMRGDRSSGPGTVPCGRCDAFNPAGSKFCNQCGAALENPTCPGCGASLTPTARFCNYCGKPVG
jgi:Double zinc ribbon